MSKLLVDPSEACPSLLQSAVRVKACGDAARQAGLQEVTRRTRFALAVEPADRAEIDDERSDPAQRPGELVVVPQGVVALGVGQDRDHALNTKLEQLIDHSRR